MKKTKAALLENQHVSVNIKDALVSGSTFVKIEEESVGSRSSGDLKVAFRAEQR